MLQSPAQLHLERQPIVRHRVLRPIVEEIAMAAGVFRLIHGGVGILQQRLRVVAVLRVKTDTEARRHGNVVLIDADRLGHGREQPLGNADDFLRLIDVL